MDVMESLEILWELNTPIAFVLVGALSSGARIFFGGLEYIQPRRGIL